MLMPKQQNQKRERAGAVVEQVAQEVPAATGLPRINKASAAGKTVKIFTE